VQRPVIAVAIASAIAPLVLALAASPVQAAGATPAANPNPGDAEPSLAFSVSPGGKPEIATTGKNGSLWFTAQSQGAWKRTQIAGTGSTGSGPSLIAEAGGAAILAVEGPAHALEYYALAGGHWHHTEVAGKNTTYSAPSLALGPSGPAIAAEGPGHDLRYYVMKTGHWQVKTVNGAGTTYSVPSLVVRQASQATANDPAGEADIAVQNASHSLSYYNSNPGGSWHNDVIGGQGTTYSAPSLIVSAPVGRTSQGGIPVIMVEGVKHSLLEYEYGTSWHSGERESANWDYSAPALMLGNPTTELAVSFEGADHSLVLTYFNVEDRSWHNDVVTVIDNAYSAAPLVVRAGHPAGEIDIAGQGPSNELRYYSAPAPGANSSPSFTGLTVAGPDTTFGGS
jgi:hypothetical protein